MLLRRRYVYLQTYWLSTTFWFLNADHVYVCVLAYSDDPLTPILRINAPDTTTAATTTAATGRVCARVYVRIYLTSC